MQQEVEFKDTDGVDDVPASPLLSEDRKNRYGSVPGLDDEELADPRELERQVFLEEFGPVLALPVRGNRSWIQAAVDENGGLDWGAFGTVDFSRTMPEFDKARYKADKLQEEVRDVLIMFSIVRERLPRVAAKVLKYLRMGAIELEHITSEDMLALAKLQLRADRIRGQIRELEEASWRRRQREAAVMMARLE